jgi:methylenetetrahydrofolate reductase (NADPH)
MRKPMDERQTRGAAAINRLLEEPDFEIFPTASVPPQLEVLPTAARVAVTCSPTRGIAATLALVEQLSLKGFVVVPHISARLVKDERHLEGIIGRLADLNAPDVFVIGGDSQRPAGIFDSANSLLNAMAKVGHDFRAVGVGAYPEGHPFIDDDTLWNHLDAKQSLASYMVTQMCFDPSAIVGWIERARSRGIHLPVRVGLPGVVGRAKLLKISLRIGVGDSLRFVKKHAGLATRMLSSGAYRPDDLLAVLAPYAGNEVYKLEGLHLYTFNQVASTEAWRRNSLRSAG